MSFVLFETAYLFLRVACHSLWPISHLHTIPLERRMILYAFMSGASISFPYLFLRSLNEVPRSSAIGNALIHHLFNGVLILESRLLRYLRPLICFLELRVIPCGLFLIFTPSLLSDVCFYTLSCQVRLSAFLTCFFIL